MLCTIWAIVHCALYTVHHALHIVNDTSVTSANPSHNATKHNIFTAERGSAQSVQSVNISTFYLQASSSKGERRRTDVWILPFILPPNIAIMSQKPHLPKIGMMSQKNPAHVNQFLVWLATYHLFLWFWSSPIITKCLTPSFITDQTHVKKCPT